MSSQFGEHVRINEYFAGRKGKFLDVGAYDGITFSNTYELYLAGWEGVLIEPSPEAFCRLKKAYREAAERRVYLCCAMLSDHTGLEGLYESECYPVSTGYTAHYQKFKQYPHTSITVGAFTWEDLKRYHKQFDFINIDTEGSNLELLKKCPYAPDMICVELDPVEETAAFLDSMYKLGMNESQIIGGNLLAWK